MLFSAEVNSVFSAACSVVLFPDLLKTPRFVTANDPIKHLSIA